MDIVLNQMAFLFSLIVIGYVLVKLGLMPENAESTLSKLENYIFIPALVLSTFIGNFTTEKLVGAKGVILGSIIIELVVIPVSMLIVRLFAKDRDTRNIFLYGLCFSNFSYVGNAIVSELYPEIFLEYLLFSLVLWTGIYIWGVPVLLMDDGLKGKGLKQRLKSFANPMFAAMIIGMVIGIGGIKVPGFVSNVVTSMGNCMSPIAMLLTGMIVARKKLLDVIKIKSVYFVTIIRLIIYPLIFIAVTKVINMPDTLVKCGLVSLAMPLGMSTIVIPAAYGKDTTVASGMALVSHALGCITIPVILYLISL